MDRDSAIRNLIEATREVFSKMITIPLETEHDRRGAGHGLDGEVLPRDDGRHRQVEHLAFLAHASLEIAGDHVGHLTHGILQLLPYLCHRAAEQIGCDKETQSRRAVN